MRNPILLLLSSFAGLLFLAGCATLTEEQCVAGDWHQLGVGDGQYGHYASRLDDHRYACRNTSAVVDEAAYFAGRDVGLRTYCTAQNGFSLGSSGRGDASVCPAELAADFQQANALGRDVHVAEQEVAEAEQEVRNLESRLRNKETELTSNLQVIEAATRRRPEADVSVPRGENRILRRDIRLIREDFLLARLAVENARDRLADVRNRTSLQMQLLTSDS